MWVFPHTTYQEIDNVDTIILEDNSQALWCQTFYVTP
jgi:hypothetical protein